MKILHIEFIVQTIAKFKIRELEVIKETEEQYKLQKGIVNKSKLLEVNTIFRNTIQGQKSTINYTVYCLLEDEQKARELLYNKAKQRIDDLNIGVLSLVNALSEFKLQITQT